MKWYQDIFPYFIVNGLLVGIVWFGATMLPAMKPVFATCILSAGFLLLYIIVARFMHRSATIQVSATLANIFPKASPYFNKVFGI